MAKDYDLLPELAYLRNLKFSLTPAVLTLAKPALYAADAFYKKNGNGLEYRSINCDGAKGYFIRPKGDEKLPLLLYYHGGAFVFTCAPYQFTLVKKYALGANVAVLMVDYSLAPKAKHPVPLNEGLCLLKYAREHAEELRIDPTRIAVGGDSAGGFLALETISQEPSAFSFGLLIYPVLDRSCSSRSMEEFVDTPVWDAKLNKKMWELYCPEPMNFAYQKEVPDNLPPLYVEATEFDPLRDEAITYANKVKESGHEVETNFTKGTVHGYDLRPGRPIAQKAIERRVAALKGAFQNN